MTFWMPHCYFTLCHLWDTCWGQNVFFLGGPTCDFEPERPVMVSAFACDILDGAIIIILLFVFQHTITLSIERLRVIVVLFDFASSSRVILYS